MPPPVVALLIGELRPGDVTFDCADLFPTVDARYRGLTLWSSVASVHPRWSLKGLLSHGRVIQALVQGVGRASHAARSYLTNGIAAVVASRLSTQSWGYFHQLASLSGDLLCAFAVAPCRSPTPVLPRQLVCTGALVGGWRSVSYSIPTPPLAVCLGLFGPAESPFVADVAQQTYQNVVMCRYHRYYSKH